MTETSHRRQPPRHARDARPREAHKPPVRWQFRDWAMI